MMSAKILRAAGTTASVMLALAGCQTLTVPNLNEPDRVRALASGDDVKNLVGGAFANWYYSTQNATPAFAGATMADHMTASWGNFGMRNYSSEPRIAFVNSSTDLNKGVVETPWYNGYGAIVGANLTLRALQAGVQIGTGGADNKMVETASRFIQGAVLADLSLFFDKAYIVDETSDPTVTPSFSTRAEVRAAGLAKLDAAIALAAGNTFTLPTTFLNIAGWSNVQLAQVANTIAARAIAYHGRNGAENVAADWPRVLSYASKGISSGTGFDPSIQGDGAVNWFDYYKFHAAEYVTWTRVDMRVVCLMDPAQPCRFPLTYPTVDVGAPSGPDFRMNGGAAADFTYLIDIPFSLARGVYHYSHIGNLRYRYTARLTPTQGLGVLPFILRAENDLLWAEALIRTNGSRATAASLINKTRVTRGHLAALSGATTDADLLNAIFYERDVEMWGASAMVPFYDMRRTNRMQALTPLHFPVPARELQVRGDPLYTFGGAANPQFSPMDGGMAAPGSLVGFPGISFRNGVLRPSDFLTQKIEQLRGERNATAHGLPF